MPPMHFLAIDVGNTRLKWAMYDAARPGADVLAHGVEFLDNIERLAEGSWAELPEPLLGSVTAVVLDLGGREAEALEGLGLTVSLASSQLSTVDEALQARTGLAAGTPITTAG